MDETEFRSRLNKLFDNDYIYNNPLSDELDVIFKEIIENNYKVNKSTYRELLKCFTIKTALNKTRACPNVSVEKKYNGFYARFANTNNGPEIVLDASTNQYNILLDMETIFHEVEHFYQSLSTHYNPLFHYILKDELLIYYFGLEYYNENYYCFASERDAYITSKNEINDYLDKKFAENSEKYKYKLDKVDDFYEIVSTQNMSDYRVLKKEFYNYNNFKKDEKFKNQYDINQIFDKFMLQISQSNGKFSIKDYMIKANKTYDDFKLGEEMLDISEMQNALSMKYNLDGSVKNILNYVNFKNKYKKILQQLQTYETDDDTLKKHYEDLIKIYDYFIYERSYSINHVTGELLDFSRYQGKDISVLEEMMLTIEMFTDKILETFDLYKDNKKAFTIDYKDRLYINYSISQIHANNTFVASDNEYFKELKNNIYKNSIELLEIIKDYATIEKAYSKKRTFKSR